MKFMGHQLRRDKTCQNCSHFVAERFCPKCGQENTETRKSFYHLFIHFAEDFVHYDGQFWRTIKCLLFSPGKLSREYLSGKRKSYMPPVQLYIFISFMTFFVPAVLPGLNEKDEETAHVEVKNQEEDEKEDGKASEKNRYNKVYSDDVELSFFGFEDVKSVNELDSIQQSLPKEKQLSPLKYYIYKKSLQKAEHFSKMDQDEFGEKFLRSFLHNLPKTLFLYMPFFAAFLWVFHSKKKWYYFDHGIYTLHFFSFMLLLILVNILFCWTTNLIFRDSTIITVLQVLLGTGSFFYSIFYFFRSHSRVYGERKAISRLKCIALFIIDTFFMMLISILYLVYTALNIH